MDSDPDQIPFIHNYCDRWCERCEFTSRCAVFAAESEMSDEEKDVTHPAFVSNLENIFAEAKRMMLERADELGIPLDPVTIDENREIGRQKRAVVRGEEITKLSVKYAKDSGRVLALKDDWLDGSASQDEIQADVIDVLYWYQFFISAKLQRGLSGIQDPFDGEDDDQIRDPQSDTNGSIKIALIAIERSILAWTYLKSADNAELLSPMIELLEQIRRLTEQKFPYAHDFIRPGFDEIDVIM